MISTLGSVPTWGRGQERNWVPSYGASKDGGVNLKSVDGPHDSCSSQGNDCLALIA